MGMTAAIKAKVVRNLTTVALARDLLGTGRFIRSATGRRIALRITGTEADHGEEGLACHTRARSHSSGGVMYAAGA